MIAQPVRHMGEVGGQVFELVVGLDLQVRLELSGLHASSALSELVDGSGELRGGDHGEGEGDQQGGKSSQGDAAQEPPRRPLDPRDGDRAGEEEAAAPTRTVTPASCGEPDSSAAKSFDA